VALFGGLPGKGALNVGAEMDATRGGRTAVTVTLDPSPWVQGGGPPVDITMWVG